nr:hypothetical protein GCM10020093_085690 [Planobispora longispora]
MLRAIGAVLAVALAVGIPTWDDYRLYRTGNPDYRFHPVAAGGTGTLMNVAWQVEVEQADSLPGAGPAKPGRQWLKIRVIRTSLNMEGVVRSAQPEVEVRHPDGRSWQALFDSNDLPLDLKEHKVGTPTVTT